MIFKSIHVRVYITICLIRIIDNQLIVKPTEKILLRDQYKSFIASCTGHSNIRVVSWRSPANVDIEENTQERITVERRPMELRLRFQNLTENDQGIWKCFGVDEYGQSISQNFPIYVKMPITFIGESIHYAELDSMIVIKCHVNANPSAEISWLKGEEKSNPLDSSNYEQRIDGLRIQRVSSKDNDVFWCRADVIETGESKDFPIQLIIAQPISAIRVSCVSPCAVEKRTATLICEANGNPTPEYSWSYGQNVPFTVNGVSKYVTRGNRLIINHIDETDTGRYTCHAFNNYDRIGQKKDYVLSVIIPPIVSSIPQIEMSIDEDKLPRMISFPCRLQRGSIENLSFQWLYTNNTPIQPINGISIENFPRSSDLIFNPVRREHHGNYTCSVKNSADTTSVIARLLIQYKPIYIGRDIEVIYAVVGHPVVLTCQFDSYPPPILQWMKISREREEILLDETHRGVHQISNEQLSPTIYETQITYHPNEEDFRLRFECRADNSQIGKHFFTLRHAKLPERMDIPRLIPTADSIEFHVKSPVNTDGLPLIEYIVKYAQIDPPSPEETISFPVLSNDSQLISIKNLQTAKSYRIQIAVRSQAGLSSFSLPVKAQTLLGMAPHFTLLSNPCENSTACLIKWQVENDGGSPITHVEILYAKVDRRGVGKDWEKNISVDYQLNEYQLTELKPDTTYLITVRLFNKAGYNERKVLKKTAVRYSGSSGAKNIIIIVVIILSILLGGVGVFLLIYFARKGNKSQPDQPQTTS